MAEKSAQKLATLLECPICLALLNNPKSFECLHFFCQSCIDDMKPTAKNGQSGYDCPLCREFSAKDKLRRIHFIQELLEIVDNAKAEQKKCTKCKVEVPTFRCVDCKCDYCQNCREQHDGFELFEHHIMNEITPHATPVIDKHVYCPKHKGELAKLYCKECKKLICLVCNGTDHKTHHAETIEDALNATLPVIKDQMEHVRKIALENEHSLAQLSTQREELEKGYETMEKQIQSKYEEFISKVQKDKQKAIDDLTKISKEHLDEVSNTEKTLQVKVRSQKTTLALCDATLTTAQNTSLLHALQTDVAESLQSHIQQHKKHTGQTSNQPRASLYCATLSTTPLIETRQAADRSPRKKQEVNQLTDELQESKISRHVSRKLSELVHQEIKLTEEVKIEGSERISNITVINKELWCAIFEKPFLRIYSFDLVHIRDIQFTKVNKCHSVMNFSSGNTTFILLAADTGLHVVDDKGNIICSVIEGKQICDISIVKENIYALNNTDSTVHTLQYDANDEQIKQIGHYPMTQYYVNYLNTIQITSECINIGQRTGNCILQYDMDGNFVRKLGIKGNNLGQLDWPILCGADDEGSLLVAELDNHCLKTVTVHGKWQRMNVELHKPSYAVAHRENLFVSEWYPVLLKKFVILD